MKIQLNGYEFEFDESSPIDISIPLNFNGPQPNAYGVEPASAKACESGDLVGDTRRGGSCNFEAYTIIPHCNGTHTECVGHITNERISVRDCLRDIFIPGALVSVTPIEGEGSAGKDFVITRQTIEELIPQGTLSLKSALIVRTLPNDESKLTRRYDSGYIPPYFTPEAMEYIVERGVKHLLVDLPSIDRLFDEGKLANHRIFWHVERGSFEVNAGTRRNSTITELIYVPDVVDDGEYLLNLQIAPFESDASPSRPLLFRLK